MKAWAESTTVHGPSHGHVRSEMTRLVDMAPMRITYCSDDWIDVSKVNTSGIGVHAFAYFLSLLPGMYNGHDVELFQTDLLGIEWPFSSPNIPYLVTGIQQFYDQMSIDPQDRIRYFRKNRSEYFRKDTIKLFLKAKLVALDEDFHLAPDDDALPIYVSSTYSDQINIDELALAVAQFARANNLNDLLSFARHFARDDIAMRGTKEVGHSIQFGRLCRELEASVEPISFYTVTGITVNNFYLKYDFTYGFLGWDSMGGGTNAEAYTKKYARRAGILPYVGSTDSLSYVTQQRLFESEYFFKAVPALGFENWSNFVEYDYYSGSFYDPYSNCSDSYYDSYYGSSYDSYNGSSYDSYYNSSYDPYGSYSDPSDSYYDPCYDTNYDWYDYAYDALTMDSNGYMTTPGDVDGFLKQLKGIFEEHIVNVKFAAGVEVRRKPNAGEAPCEEQGDGVRLPTEYTVWKCMDACQEEASAAVLECDFVGSSTSLLAVTNPCSCLRENFTDVRPGFARFGTCGNVEADCVEKCQGQLPLCESYSSKLRLQSPAQFIHRLDAPGDFPTDNSTTLLHIEIEVESAMLVTEYLEVTFQDLIVGLGGTAGFFMGISVLSIMHVITSTCQAAVDATVNRKKGDVYP